MKNKKRRMLCSVGEVDKYMNENLTQGILEMENVLCNVYSFDK